MATFPSTLTAVVPLSAEFNGQQYHVGDIQVPVSIKTVQKGTVLEVSGEVDSAGLTEEFRQALQEVSTRVSQRDRSRQWLEEHQHAFERIVPDYGQDSLLVDIISRLRWEERQRALGDYGSSLSWDQITEASKFMWRKSTEEKLKELTGHGGEPAGTSGEAARGADQAEPAR